MRTFPAQVTTVHFLDLPGPPRVGFVGSPGAIYKTTDGGLTWTMPTVNEPYIHPSDFTFKDSLVGWFSNWVPDPTTAQCFMTTDGGDTWNAVHGPTFYCSGIHYNAAHSLLLLAGWSAAGVSVRAKSCFSTDEGKSWSVFNFGTELNGFAFHDGDNGIVSGKQGNYLRTTDGGFTWADVTRTGDEAWQPLADASSNNYWTAAENRLPFISRDLGNIFAPLTQNVLLTSGTIRMGTCRKLYIQYQAENAYPFLGILRSLDSGFTWNTVRDKFGNSGPVNLADTRFYVKGDFIYAGGRDTIDRKVFTLWRYVDDSTRFTSGTYGLPFVSSHQLQMISPKCGIVDTSLRINFSYECATADLIEVKVLPSNRFTIALNDKLPFRIQHDYLLPLVYSPLGHGPDDADIALTYLVNGQKVYDTVHVNAFVPGDKQFARFDIFADNAKVTDIHAGGFTKVTIRLLDGIADSVGVDSIAFETNYDPNVLSFTNAMTVSLPWSIFRTSHAEGKESIVLRRTKGSTLVANSDIVSYQFKGFVSTNSSTLVTIDSLRLNDNDSLFSLCYATASHAEGALVKIGPDCGDSTLRAYMDGIPFAQILTIVASKTGTENFMRIRSDINADAVFTLYAANGVMLRNDKVALHSGDQQLPLTVTELPHGMYFITLESNGYRTSARFILND